MRYEAPASSANAHPHTCANVSVATIVNQPQREVTSASALHSDPSINSSTDTGLLVQSMIFADGFETGNGGRRPLVVP